MNSQEKNVEKLLHDIEISLLVMDQSNKSMKPTRLLYTGKDSKD